MDKIIITGGTGFIGMSLSAFLAQNGFRPVLIARNKPKGNIPYQFAQWDGRAAGDWAGELEGAKAIVNLAGRTVDCIKNPENCDEILRSRINAVRAIGEAMRKVTNPPKVWIQMSTAHIYGDSINELCAESSTFGYGLAPFVALRWEEELLKNLPKECREVRLRTSFVIGKDGGALSTLVKIARMGLGGPVGHGRQGISWIHEHDLNRLIMQAIYDSRYEGPIIASAPNPVTNEEFMKALRRSLRMPIALPVPEFMARLGAKFVFHNDPELAIYGRFVRSERLEKLGFMFDYPEIHEALNHLNNSSVPKDKN